MATTPDSAASPRAVRSWSAVLADRAQERRFRATRTAGVRRDVQVVAGIIALSSGWDGSGQLTNGGPSALLAAAAQQPALLLNVLLLGLCAGGVPLVRRQRTWEGAAAVLVGGVLTFAALNAWCVLTHVFTPVTATVIAVVCVAGLYLYAQLPLALTVCLGVGWTVISTSSLALALAERPDPGGAEALVQAVVLMPVVNAIGVLSARRSAVGERLLFANGERVEGLSLVDPLTGAANRRGWQEGLDAAWARCARMGLAVGVVLVDVDEFKAVNDRFGHAGGDEVLKVVAAVLAQRARRPDDLVARLGGDEFALLLPATPVEGVSVVAEHLLAAVREVRARSGPHEPGSALSLSIGAAAFVPGRGLSCQEAVAEVDALLYRAKAEGRDRLRCAVASAVPASDVLAER